jgi:hypothetical protein
MLSVSSFQIVELSGGRRCSFHYTGASSPFDHATRFLPSARIQKVVYLAHTHVPGFLLLLSLLWITQVVDVDLADQ